MLDQLKKIISSTGNYIIVNIDENKKIQIPFSDDKDKQPMNVGEIIVQNVKEITKDQNSKKQNIDLSKQFCVLISIKDKQGNIFKRFAHTFELIRDHRELLNNIAIFEYHIVRNHNFYIDESRKSLFLSQKLDQNDKFYLKGPLEKRSSRDGKFKKKQVSLFKNYIQYSSGNRIKYIPLEDIKSVGQSTDQSLKNTFYMITKQKHEGFYFKAESLINLNKWITTIQQNLNYFRDTKLTLNYEEKIEKDNEKVTKEIVNQTNNLLYHLENIVKKPKIVQRIYKNVEQNFVKLQKFDRDLLFQVMSIHNDPKSFDSNIQFLKQYVKDQSQQNQTFNKFLETFKISEQFHRLGQNVQQLVQSRSIEDNLNESNQDMSKSMNLSNPIKQRNKHRFLSSYQSHQSFLNDTIEQKLKQIYNPLERLNYIFISYMTTQYKTIIKFSEMISQILCNQRVQHNHYHPEIILFQYQVDPSQSTFPFFREQQNKTDKLYASQRQIIDDRENVPQLQYIK